jgi:hypothetical protein
VIATLCPICISHKGSFGFGEMYIFLESTRRDKFNGIYHCCPNWGQRSKIGGGGSTFGQNSIFYFLRAYNGIFKFCSWNWIEWYPTWPGADYPRRDSQHPPGIDVYILANADYPRMGTPSTHWLFLPPKKGHRI